MADEIDEYELSRHEEAIATLNERMIETVKSLSSRELQVCALKLFMGISVKSLAETLSVEESLPLVKAEIEEEIDESPSVEVSTTSRSKDLPGVVKRKVKESGVKIKLGVGEDMSREQLAVASEQFWKKVKDWEEAGEIPAGDAAMFHKTFFGDLTGETAIKQIRDVCTAVRQGDGASRNATAVALERLADTSKSVLEKKFMGSMARYVGSDVKKDALHSYRTRVAMVELYQAYHELHTALMNSKAPGFAEHLASLGLKPSRGRRWATVLKQYFCGREGFGYDEDKFEALLRQAAPIHALVVACGYGVLVMCPRNIHSRLLNLTLRRCHAAIALFITLVPTYERVCAMVAAKVNVGIAQGEWESVEDVGRALARADGDTMEARLEMAFRQQRQEIE